jgi:hypothetical protein
MRGTLRSKKFWLGAVVGTVAGGWVLGKVGVGIPRMGNGG